MKGTILLLLLTVMSCPSRTEKINKRLTILNGQRDSLNIRYNMLQLIKDSLRHIAANKRQQYGRPDSTVEVQFFENDREIQSLLDKQNAVSMQIRAIELK